MHSTKQKLTLRLEAYLASSIQMMKLVVKALALHYVNGLDWEPLITNVQDEQL